VIQDVKILLYGKERIYSDCEENRIKRYPEELTEEEIEGCIYYGEEGERIIKKLLKRIVALEEEVKHIKMWGSANE